MMISRILITDDSEMNRSILLDILGEEYEIVEAENGAEAVVMLRQYASEISLVLLDIVMPEMDGFEVLSIMNKEHWIEDIPVIIISAENSSTYLERAFDLGVTDYISRPFDDLIVHRRVINTILLYGKQKRLLGMVADQIFEKEKRSSLMIDILSHIVEFRNGESGMHVINIHTITEYLLKNLGRISDKYQFTHEEIEIISTASALHDVGKIAIPSEVLNKPGKFTDEEYAIMKKLFYLMMLALPMIFVACDDDDNLPRVDITVDFDNVANVDGELYIVKGDSLIVNSINVTNLESGKKAIATSAIYYLDGIRIGASIFSPFYYRFPTENLELDSYRFSIETEIFAVDKTPAVALLSYDLTVVESKEDIPNGIDPGQGATLSDTPTLKNK